MLAHIDIAGSVILIHNFFWDISENKPPHSHQQSSRKYQFKTTRVYHEGVQSLRPSQSVALWARVLLTHTQTQTRTQTQFSWNACGCSTATSKHDTHSPATDNIIRLITRISDAESARAHEW